MGLGQHIAEALSQAGASVVLCSRKLETLEEVKAKIEGRGGEALALACDVTDSEDVNDVVARTEEAFGAINALVDNSGSSSPQPPTTMTGQMVIVDGGPAGKRRKGHGKLGFTYREWKGGS